NFTLYASVADPDDPVTQVEFFQNGSSVGTISNAPFNLARTGLTPANYTFQAVATDRSGLSATSAPVTVIVFVDSGPPVAAITAPVDATILTAPSNFIGTASSPILQSYQLQYRLKGPDGVTPAPWANFATGSVSVVNAALGTLDPTLLL